MTSKRKPDSVTQPATLRRVRPAAPSRVPSSARPHSPAAPLNGSQPLYAQLRERLRADILEGRLAPLQQLPSEHELIAAYGISRITVRQALSDLHKEGLVVKVHGRGTFVAPAHMSQSLSRLAGVGETAAGAGHVVHGQLLAIGDAAADGEVARALGVAPGSRVIEWTSLRYLDREPLSLNHSFVPPAFGDRLRRIDFASRDLLSVFERELRLDISHAELEISAGAASRTQARHLKVATAAPVLRLRRIVYATDGTPLQLETTVYRSDEFSYRVRVERR